MANSQRINKGAVDALAFVSPDGGTTWVPMTQPGGGSGGAVTIADGADVAEGTTTDAAWSGSGAGTVIAILKKIATGGSGGGPATIADGADVAEGATTDAAVTTDSNGTVSGKLRGLVKIFASVWDSVNGRLKVDGSGVTQPISAASLPLPTNAAQETGGNLAAIKADTDLLNDTTSGPTTFSSGSGGPITINTPGGGTVFFWFHGTATGNLTIAEQFTAAGSFVSATGYTMPSANLNNPVQNYQHVFGQFSASSYGTDWIVAVETHGIAIQLGNSVATGSLAVSTVFKRNFYGIRPAIISGAVAGYGADVNTNNELFATLLGASGNNVIQWTGMPIADGISSPGGRNTFISQSTGLLYNGTTFDRTPGDKTNGMYVNVKVLPAVAGGNTPGDSVSNPTNAVPDEAFLMGWDASNNVWRRVQVDMGTGTLKVDAGTVTVSGAVTANQGGAPWSVVGPNTPADGLANPTNTVPTESFLMAWDATNNVWNRVQVDPTTGTLKVDPGTVTVTGSVTAAQGSPPWSVVGPNTPGDTVSNPTNAVPEEAFMMGWDATNSVWRRVQVDATTGTVKVDPGAIVGNDQPSDAFLNPSNAVPAQSFLMGWDSTNTVWRRIQANSTTGALKTDTSFSTAGSIISVGGTVASTVVGQSASVMFLQSSLVGTVVAEYTYNGATWFSTSFYDPIGRTAYSSISFSAPGGSNPAAGYGITLPGGVSQVRIRCTTLMTGSLTLGILATGQQQPSSTAIANAATPMLTEGEQYFQTMDLSGNTRVILPPTQQNDFNIMGCLRDIVAELRAIHVQLGLMGPTYVDTDPFVNDNDNYSANLH